MHCVKKINDTLYWVGGTDRRLALFENVYPIPKGISYNAYVMIDEKTVLFDTVDQSVGSQFLENVKYILGGRSLDYMIVHHMEPDHCSMINEIVKRYPDVEIICNIKTAEMIRQFFSFDIDAKAVLVKEGDTFLVGKHNLTFLNAPMVHWPEVMVTYDLTDKILFSADVFGSFGSMNGNLFADEVNFEHDWLDDARRYYTNIVGKYGPQAQELLKKASGLEISMICPLHGLVWRENIEWFVDKYLKWTSYTPEKSSVLIIYGSIYEHTENMVNILASYLADFGVRDIAVYDVSSIHPSYILSEAFRRSHLVFASVTHNGGIFSNMEHLLLELKAHNLQKRTVAVMDNGSWFSQAGKQMKDIFSEMKNVKILEQSVSIKSILKKEQMVEVEALAHAIAKSVQE
ncbi:MAG: FprA family A-type flavoprotein [Lachnospiraceae bacterium]|nr:FprA family A-type flavoprotein [Lachnospiraceae bacterium]